MGYTNELYHHGIKGQKWGVRRFQNPDGSRTAAGRKRESVTRKKATAENAEKLAELLRTREGRGSKELTSAIRSVVKGGADSEFDKALSDTKVYADQLVADTKEYRKNLERYSTIAGNAAANRRGETSDDAESTVWMYVHEDLDQGPFNSFDHYLCAKGSDPKKFAKRFNEATDKIRSESERVAGDMLGSHANEKIEMGTPAYSTTAKQALGARIREEALTKCGLYNSDNFDYYWRETAYNGTDYTSKEIAQMKADVKRYANAPIPDLWHSDARQNYLMHFGIKGQKWGVRRFQNPDGTRTPEGAARELKRYRKRELHTLDRMNRKQTKKDDKQIAKAQIKMSRAAARGGPLFRKARVTKQQYKLENLKQQKLYRQGLYASERAKVMRMTIGEMDSEKAGLTKNRGERSVMQMFSKGRLDREFKTSQRVTEEQRQNAYSNAYMMRSAMA